MWAAEEAYDNVVEMLLARHDLNLHTLDFSGGTALSLATSKGHSAVVELLSEHNHSLTNSSDINEAPEHPLTGAVRPLNHPLNRPPQVPLDLQTLTPPPPNSRSPLRNSCICWNRHNSR
ncbi:hypothetical protein L873DRAFT_360917 [Choiromyces venosus 120613-1]|uniref:Uncharacterized protein n=1 Tax=Choiromyces venosus 120613-1 TaxID=1336337 RepID=A0A3N4JAW6_9PEZI|nr:hypothetical protein L873DRAFT_360917 [Choiromyces venosus 120613-1]